MSNVRHECSRGAVVQKTPRFSHLQVIDSLTRRTELLIVGKHLFFDSSSRIKGSNRSRPQIKAIPGDKSPPKIDSADSGI